MALSSQTAVSGTVYKSIFTTGTESAPTLSTDGQALEDFIALYVQIAADNTRTLSGAGTLECWLYDPVSGGPAAWTYTPELNLTVPSGAASKRYCGFAAREVLAPRGARIMFIPNGVTLSAGGLTIYQYGFNPALRGNY